MSSLSLKLIKKISLSVLIVIFFCFCEKKERIRASSFQENKKVNIVIEEEISIGVESGEAEYIFSQIMPIRKDQITIAVDEREQIYVLDYEQCIIKSFDKTGNHLRTFGKKGQGPGEMQSPLSIFITRNNEIMVEDVRTRCLHFFSLEGEYRDSLSTAKGYRILKFKTNSLGNLIGLEVISRTGEILYELNLFDRELNPIRTLASYTFTVSLSTMNVFTPTLHYSLFPNDLILYGFPDVYELKIIDFDGREIRKINKKFDPIEVTIEEREAIARNFPQDTKIRFPKFHNAFRYFTVDEQGRIFIQTWEKTRDGKNFYYDVFDDNGNYITKIPLEVQPLLWKKNKLYTVVENESGYQSVKRYHVTWKNE